MQNFNMKRFFSINLGIIILVIGLYYFLIPSKLAVGGVSGLAMVVNRFFPVIPIGAIMLFLNLILLILAFILIGKEFGGYTIYASLAISGLTYLLEIVSPMNQPLVNNIGLNLIYGIMISGIGMGIIFYQNASTGGTDILAKIINKYTHIDIGKSLLMSDFVITLLAGLAFGMELGMYALIGVILNSLVIDNIIGGFNKKMNLMILSGQYEEINDFILKELGRGTTLFHVVGGHSMEEKMALNTIVSKREYIRIKKFLKEKDPRAFMYINFASEVLGEGFLSH